MVCDFLKNMRHSSTSSLPKACIQKSIFSSHQTKNNLIQHLIIVRRAPLFTSGCPKHVLFAAIPKSVLSRVHNIDEELRLRYDTLKEVNIVFGLLCIENSWFDRFGWRSHSAVLTERKIHYCKILCKSPTMNTMASLCSL